MHKQTKLQLIILGRGNLSSLEFYFPTSLVSRLDYFQVELHRAGIFICWLLNIHFINV